MNNTNACMARGVLSAPPEMAEARNLATGSGFVEETQGNTKDSAASVAVVQNQAKVFATLAARAALLRCVLRCTETGYVITRTGWGLSRHLVSLADVESLLKLMEGTR